MLVPVRVPYMGKIDLSNHLIYLKPFNCVQIKLLMLYSNAWNHLTVCKQMSQGSFKSCYEQTIRLQIQYLMYAYKQELALYNLQGWICHKIQPTNRKILNSCNNIKMQLLNLLLCLLFPSILFFIWISAWKVFDHKVYKIISCKVMTFY